MPTRQLTSTATLWELTGLYGQSWREGVILDHLGLAEASPHIKIHHTPTGRVWLYPTGGGQAVPLVCAEIIEVWTEDGRSSGRCGAPLTHDECPVHGKPWEHLEHLG